MLITDIVKDVSDRRKHFLLAIPCGFLFTILFVLGIATGMEFKDKKYGNIWDWKDWIATVLGGIVGNGLLILLYYLIF
jgi:hypothetical protein